MIVVGVYSNHAKWRSIVDIVTINDFFIDSSNKEQIINVKKYQIQYLYQKAYYCL